MEPTDITVEILKDIRDEIRSTNGRLDQTNARLDQTIARLDQTNGRLEEINARLDETNTRVVHSEIRTATAITDLHGSVHELIDHLRASSDLRPRVERCELEIVELKRRLP